MAASDAVYVSRRGAIRQGIIAVKHWECYRFLGGSVMDKSNLIASALTVLVVLGLVAYRMLWAASQVASSAGLGRISILPKNWRRWLLGEPKDAPRS